ncbi:site-specific integrase [Pseudonocardia sp. ICBG1293]|uniref:tyrosine-type recombinase/integrase n=1 Tax=Pseudonocardia sp. ICBG1293 TaxID=2844382 RepID=UPI001CCF2B21|nr:site-specific integrase [Pseudonocardia sp. ICBG1293]
MGHVEDRWWREERDPATGRTERRKTERFGRGHRYRVRFLDPDGRERSRSFPDRRKRAADEFLVSMESDKSHGSYIDPKAGRITFGDYAGRWLASQTFEASTHNSVTWRLNAQILPFFERRELGAISPTDVRTWIRGMQDRGVAESYQAGCFAHVSSILTAAVDDRLIRENPCHARSVVRPKRPPVKVIPWSRQRVDSIRAAMRDRLAIFVALGAGCGLRQGEAFGMSPDDIDRKAGVLHVVRQVRLVDSRLVFAPPKRNKTRDVPIPTSVLDLVDDHMNRFPPVPVTLPWRTPSGEPTTVPLLITDERGGALRRNHFNEAVWNPARKAAGVQNPTRQDGTHALRHYYASVLLDAGENIRALSEYLGHHDPGFTLRTYTHLMPSSSARTRRAIDAAFGGREDRPDGPGPAQSDSQVSDLR